jgi:2-iminobutanoate/2-iminopropanoate deaminase
VRQAISAPYAPQAIGPYSPAIKAGNLLFLSGQIPIDPATSNLVAGDIAAQTEQVMRNIAGLLMADMNDFGAMNAVYARFVVDPPPARATVQVARLPRDAKVEIDVIAVLK